MIKVVVQYLRQKKLPINPDCTKNKSFNNYCRKSNSNINNKVGVKLVLEEKFGTDNLKNFK